MATSQTALESLKKKYGAAATTKNVTPARIAPSALDALKQKYAPATTQQAAPVVDNWQRLTPSQLERQRQDTAARSTAQNSNAINRPSYQVLPIGQRGQAGMYDLYSSDGRGYLGTFASQEDANNFSRTGSIITDKNVLDYLDYAREIAAKNEWTENERNDAQAIYDAIKPRGIFNDGSLGQWWNDQKYMFTYDPQNASVWNRVQNGDLKLDWQDTYAELYNRLHPASTGFMTGLLEGTGATSLSKAAANGLDKLGADTSGLRAGLEQIDEIAQRGREEAPLAVTAGNVTGSVALLGNISNIIGAAVPALANAAPIVRSAVSSGLSMGGMSAVQGLGNATESGDWGKYLADVGVSAGAGAAGGAASNLTGGALSKYLLGRLNLTQNTLAQAGVSGAASSVFALTDVGAKQLARKLGYDDSVEVTPAQLAQDVLIAGIFGFVSDLAMSGARKGEYTTPEPTDDAGRQAYEKWFGDTPTDEVKHRYRDLAKQYHTDTGHGDEEVMKELNAAYEYFTKRVMQSAQGSYTRAARAKASGNEAEYQAASADFQREVLALQEAAADGAISGEAAGALEVLSSVAANGIAVTDTATAANAAASAVSPALAGATPTETPAAGSLTPAGENGAAAQKTGNTEHIKNGGITDGAGEETVHIRDGGEWADGSDSGGQVRELEESAGRDQSRHETGKPRDREAARLVLGKEITTASLGIGRGSKTDKIRLIAKGETASMRSAKALAKEHGLRAVFYAGGNLTIGGERVRGYVSGDRVFVRADHPQFTADQLMRHEVGHDMIARGEVDLAEVRERVEQLTGAGSVQDIADAYAGAYEDGNLTPEQIFEEIVCDSLGDMNIFEQDLPSLGERFGGFLKTLKGVTEDSRKTARGPPAANADGRASVETTTENKPFVNVTADILKDVPESDWVKTVKDNLKEKFPNGMTVGNNQINIDRATRKEMTFSRYMQWLYNNDAQAWSDKLRATNNADEILQATTDWIDTGLNHPRRDNIADFASGDVLMRIGENDYAARVVVGTEADGYMRLYDVLDLQPTRFTAKETGAVKAANPSPGTDRKPATVSTEASPQRITRKAGSTALGRETSTDSVRDNSEDVNGKNSREAASLEALREENDALRERLDELKAAAQEAKKQTARADYWQGQTKRTEAATLRHDDVDRLARSLVKGYSSTANAAEISADLMAAGNYLVRGGDESGELSYEALKERVLPIAREIVQGASELRNGEDMDVYRDIKSLLGRKMSLSASDASGIADFKDWRKRNRGKVNVVIGGDGLPVDIAYDELSDAYPWLFPAEIANPTDQALQMVDALDSLAPIYENPYSYHMAEATEYCANEIIDALISEGVRQMPPTFADRQAAKLDAAKAHGREQVAKLREQKNARIEEIKRQGRERTREAVKRERERRKEQIAALREHNAEVRRNQAERRADSNARTRLQKIAKRLANKKLPAVNRALLNQYIGDLDTISKGMTGKTLEKLSTLEDWYLDQKENNPDFISDPSIEKKLRRLHDRHIADMTSEEVSELTDVLLNIENEIRTQRKLIDAADRRDTYVQGVQAIRDIENSRGTREGVLGGLDKLFINNTLSPVRELRRLTGYVDDDPLYTLTKELADGQRKQFDYQRKAGDHFQKWTEDKKFVRKIKGKDAEEISVQGIGKDGPTSAKITPAMRMSLYLHAKNDQNLRHIAGGGVTVPDMKLYKRGKMQAAYDRGTTIKLTPSQVRAITAGMTAQEKAFADAASAYYTDMSQPAINETSEKLKGYSIATVENYFPIDTDKSFLKTDFDALKFDGTLEGMGFLQERINSAAPIMLYDLDSVLRRSVEQHAKYVGLAVPVRNFNKVWGVTKGSFNEDGTRNNFESSVQQAVKQKWGDAGYKYIEKLMTDLQSGHSEQNDWDKLLRRVRSNYAGAVLTLNASVAMKQAASYPTAGAVVGFKPLARAMADFGKVDLETINKYTPLLWYRSQGFSTQELGDMAKQDKQLPTVLNWVQGVDVLTTRKLWKAAEYYARQNDKSLRRGSEEYYRAVADVYNEIIEDTQPNYTTMQRPQLLRSDSSLLQSLSMFKTQPFQNFNIVYDAFGNLEAKARQAKNDASEQAQDAYKTAKKRAAWAAVSQLMQLAVFAGMTAAWNLFRGKTANYADDEGEVTIGSALRRIGRDMIGSAASSVPFGSDVWELASSMFLGETYYGFDDVTSSAIDDLANAFKKAGKSLSCIWEDASSGEAVDWNEQRLQWDSVLKAASKITGKPYENIENLFNATFRRAAVAAEGKHRGTYAYLRLTTSPSSGSASYYDNLYDAYRNDKDAYEEIYRSMIESGDFTEDKIKNAMESRMKKSEGVESVKDLGARYLAPEAQTAYDETLGKMQRSSVWRGASAEQREKAEGMAYDLASGNNSGAKMQENIDGGAGYGLDSAEYILYRLALSMTDEPTESGKLGTYTNAEVEAAIRMVPNLTDAERDYLWTAQGKSAKNTPKW